MKRILLLMGMVSIINATENVKSVSNQWSTNSFDQNPWHTQANFSYSSENQLADTTESNNLFFHTEKSALYHLYQAEIYNSCYYKLNNFPLDYYIAILEKHIKKLEDKITQKKDWLDSTGKYKVFLTSLFSGFATGAMYASYRDPKQESSLIAGINFGLISAILAYITTQQINKLYRYQERVIARLARDKRILTKLEQEKREKNAQLNNQVNKEMVNTATTVLSSIGSAIEKVTSSTSSNNKNNDKA